MDRVSARVEHRDDGTTRVTLEGAITQETNAELKALFQKVLEKNPRKVDLDCVGVDYIASAGVGALVSLLRKLREMNSTLRVLNLQPDIEQLFAVTHLDKIFTVARDSQSVPTA
jgi:anti-sigma B factor antagonist